VGILASFLYLSVTSRVHLCVCCNRPAVFRRFRGNWTCVVCGKPR
jgi:ribosomal protein L37AE/L43A